MIAIPAVPAKTASFIYRAKTGSFHEFIFLAEDDDDLRKKGEFLTETMMGQMTGSIFWWTDDEDLAYYRESVA